MIFSPLHSSNEAYYDRMRNELVRQYLVVRPMMEVNLRTAPIIQGNTFENLPIIASSPDVSEIGDGMKNIPFILVGAGPSLDESIDFLKSVQDKSIIVCSNSPLRKLLHNGIKPHLVVTADPQEPTLAGFKGLDLAGLTLVCPYSAYPEIVRLFEGRILSWCTFNPIVDLVKNTWVNRREVQSWKKARFQDVFLIFLDCLVVKKFYLSGKICAFGMTVVTTPMTPLTRIMEAIIQALHKVIDCRGIHRSKSWSKEGFLFILRLLSSLLVSRVV